MNGRDLGASVVALAGIAWFLRPQNRPAEVLSAMQSGFAASIRAAAGGAVAIPSEWGLPERTPAEWFASDAAAEIAEFWQGFE
jgi:hypothetical protein